MVFRAALNWTLMMPRGASFSDDCTPDCCEDLTRIRPSHRAISFSFPFGWRKTILVQIELLGGGEKQTIINIHKQLQTITSYDKQLKENKNINIQLPAFTKCKTFTNDYKH